MEVKNFALRITGTIFGAVAVLHLLRVITGVPVLIDDWALPVSVNLIGLMATAFLCGWLWALSFRKSQ